MKGIASGSFERVATVEGAQLLIAALYQVDSVSIREWATCPANFAIWLTMSSAAAARGKGQTEDGVMLYATYIVATAIGL